MMPLGVSLVQETTVFREYGPVAGNTFKLSFDASPGIRRQLALAPDGRCRRPPLHRGWRRTACFAVRFKGFRSWGRNPDFIYFGGNSEMRGYEYLQFIGQNGFFANAELRFPLIEAMLTPLGVLGGLRGVFFANIGGASFTGQGYPFGKQQRRDLHAAPRLRDHRHLRQRRAGLRPSPIVVDGLRLVDGRASYGLGLESFILGFPMHFDWSWKTLLQPGLGGRALRLRSRRQPTRSGR